MTKSYQDGIIDCLKIMNNYKLSGIYDIPIKYIEEAIFKLLPADFKLNENDITSDPKKSLENVEYLDDKQYIQSFEE